MESDSIVIDIVDKVNVRALFCLAGLPRRYAPDETTSHLTKAASCQVIGYRNDGFGGLLQVFWVRNDTAGVITGAGLYSIFLFGNK